MSDKLNQISKSIRQTRRDTDAALNRYAPNIPKTEQVRDTFDKTIPFEMSFKTPKGYSRVEMTLFFKPPPPSACCGDCFCTVCETFTGESSIQLTYGYIQNALNVFVNGTRITTFSQTNPNAGILTITSSVSSTAKVRVCYVYNNGENCT